MAVYTPRGSKKPCVFAGSWAGKAPAFEVYASDDQAADVARRIAGLLNDGPS